MRDRIAALSPADLTAQLARISRALSETIHTRYSTEPEHAAAHRARRHFARFPRRPCPVDCPRAGRAGLKTPHGIGYAGWALLDETGPRRHHLYDGLLGPAVFLAAAAVVSGEDRWRRAARDFADGA